MCVVQPWQLWRGLGDTSFRKDGADKYKQMNRPTC